VQLDAEEQTRETPKPGTTAAPDSTEARGPA
jgi:hypothetical protein